MKKNYVMDSIAIHCENISNKIIAKQRRKKLNNTDFSIISNNCWGGHVYRRFGIPYSSPTIGLYFYSNDYIELLSDLQHYFNTKIHFISYKESKYKDELICKNQINIPIGILDDKVEIMFLHYHSESEAYERWNRRCERVNYENLIVKNSQMNGCTLENLEQFDKMNYKKKIAFVTKQNLGLIKCGVTVEKYANDDRIIDDTTYYSRHIDLEKLIKGGIYEIENGI